jgi:thioredoxin reductase (NADPH)
MVAHDLYAVAFPTFEETQIETLARCTGAALQRYRAGQRLFEAGDRNFKFFLLKSGEIEIFDESDDAPKSVVVHHAGEFTGDISHLTGRASVVGAVARVDSDVYEISGAGVRQVVSRCPELGDIILQAFIARRQLLRDSGTVTGLRVIGSRYSHDTFRIRDFLSRNRIMFTWLDLEADPQVNQLLAQFGVTMADTPVVSYGHKVFLRNPSNLEIAEVTGLHQPLEQAVYDLVVVGAGPAGLAAAVYGASEGLRTVVLERVAPGGQAGRSMRIENYLGFPTGVTGAELAERAILQANKFGAQLPIATPAASLYFDNSYKVLNLENGETVVAKCLLIATGADYRLLDVEGCPEFEGSGVYYAATPNEVGACTGADVIVVGGGNSAGQAAVFLARHARKVYVVVRAGDLHKDMSAYLAWRIEEIPNIEVLVHTEVRRMSGDGHLGSVEIVDNQTGKARAIQCPALFSFIGAVPRTEWLPPEIEKDAKAFVLTGPALAQSPHWTIRRQPFLLETSHPGVFAAGDVRSGSIKRVASAVGEGSMVVQFVHEYLKEM